MSHSKTARMDHSGLHRWRLRCNSSINSSMWFGSDGTGLGWTGLGGHGVEWAGVGWARLDWTRMGKRRRNTT